MPEDKSVSSRPGSSPASESGVKETSKEKNQKTAERGGGAAGKFAASVGKVHSRVNADLAEVEKLKSEVELLRNQLRLAVADSKNLERLLLKEVADAKVFSISEFARDLVSSLDNLEASLKNLSPDDSVHTGIKMTWESLMTALASHGVERIFPVDEMFDTKFHTAVTQAVDNKRPAGTILEVIQAGYILNGKVLRPASVVVSKQES